MEEALILGGIAIVAAGIVGGGLKLFGSEFPVIQSRDVQVIVIVLGVAVLGGGMYLKFFNGFRVTGVDISSDSIGVFICPSTVTYTARVTTAGGDGRIEYRFVSNGIPKQAFLMDFSGATGRSVTQAVQISPSLPGLPRLGPDRMYLEILAPNHMVSETAQTSVLCP